MHEAKSIIIKHNIIALEDWILKASIHVLSLFLPLHLVNSIHLKMSPPRISAVDITQTEEGSLFLNMRCTSNVSQPPPTPTPWPVSFVGVTFTWSPHGDRRGEGA